MTKIMLLFLLGSIQLSHEINEISHIRKLNLINLSISSVAEPFTT